MAIYNGFRSTNVWNAFILNSIVSALVILIALVVKGKLDTYTDKNGDNVIRSTSWKSVVITFVATFFASFTAFTLMHITLDYGGGQLVNE